MVRTFFIHKILKTKKAWERPFPVGFGHSNFLSPRRNALFFSLSLSSPRCGSIYIYEFLISRCLAPEDFIPLQAEWVPAKLPFTSMGNGFNPKPTSGSNYTTPCVFSFLTKFLQATNELVALVPEATQSEMRAATEAAQKAFPAWRDTSVSARARIMFKLQELITENMV